jgi:hypothetical protein
MRQARIEINSGGHIALLSQHLLVDESFVSERITPCNLKIRPGQPLVA